jgi:hypothetical protein
MFLLFIIKCFDESHLGDANTTIFFKAINCKNYPDTFITILITYNKTIYQ